MIDVTWHPTPRQLRLFGWVSVAGFTALALLVGWRTGAFRGDTSWTIPLILWGLALLTGFATFIEPRSLRPLYLVLTILALPIGLVISNLVLVMIFGLFIVPLALWFRLIGRDELRRHPTTDRDSFWIKSGASRQAADYYRPF